MSRFLATASLDMRLQWRNGFYLAAAVAAMPVALIGFRLAAADIGWLMPAIIVMHLVAGSFYFTAALALLEQDEGTRAAQVVSPLRPAEYLGAKVATLGALALAEHLLIVAGLAGFRFNPLWLALGVGLASALFVLVGFAVAARYDSLNALLLPSILVAGALALPAAASAMGWRSWLLLLHPMQPAVVLLRAAFGAAGPWELVYALLYGSVALVGAAMLALRAYPPLRARRHRMTIMLVVRALGPIEARSIRRDELLRWLLILPPLLTLGARFLLPAVAARLSTTLGIDIGAIVPLVIGMVALTIGPILCGMVVGFLLLDQRDDGTLTALRVTPLPPALYLAYRVGLPMAICLPVTALAIWASGISGDLAGLLAALAAGLPIAPLAALLLAVFATNKVQGVALMKAMSVLFIAPLAALFIAEPWRRLFGVFPTFWPVALLDMARAGAPTLWTALAAGLAYDAALLWLLVRRLARASA